MQTQKALLTSESSPVFVEAEKLIEGAQQLTQEIARRAYGFFERRDRMPGYEAEDWLQAEAEVLRPIPVELKDAGEQLIVNAEVPGFKGDEIRISTEPRLVVIEGNNETSNEEKSTEVVFSERRSNQFFRTLALPVDVDPAKATASLKNGMLEVTLPKSQPSRAATIDVKSN